MKIQSSKFKMQNCSLKFKIFGFVLNFALLVVTFNFALLTFNLNKAEASALSIGVFPPITQIEANPPSSIKTPITVQNFGDEVVSLDIFLNPFTQDENESGMVRYLLPSSPSYEKYNLIFQKMQITEDTHAVKEITLAPGQQKSLSLHIGLDKDQSLSDYYFSVIFVSKANNPLRQPADGGQKNQSNISKTPGGVATNVLLTVGSKEAAQGTLEEFSSPFLNKKGPVPFTVRVKNKGRQIIEPKGEILIKNMFGQTVGKVDLLPVNILAGTTRSLPDSLQSPGTTPSAIFNSVKAFWPESFLLGPYTATLTLALSEDGPLFTRKIQFVGVPFQILIGIFVVIIIFLFIKSRLKKHF